MPWKVKGYQESDQGLKVPSKLPELTNESTTASGHPTTLEARTLFEMGKEEREEKEGGKRGGARQVEMGKGR